MELRLKRQRESIAADTESEHRDDRVLEIYDLAGVSVKQISVKGIKMLSHSITLCQAHYPEDLAQTFVINAPPHFNAAWNILKGVMNERTRAKIQVSSGDFDGRLAELVGGRDVLAGLLNSVQPPPESRG